MRLLVRTVPTAMALVVAAASFALSYVALCEVSTRVGAVPGRLAFLVPIVVDGGILAASSTLWAGSMYKRRRDPFAYLTLIVLLGFSVVINVHHASGNTLAQCIAGLPPLALMACLELVAAGMRDQVSTAIKQSTRKPTASRQSAVVQAEPHPAAPAPASPVAAAPVAAGSSVAADTGAELPTWPGGRNGSAAQQVRAAFDEHVLAGGDPADPRLAATIAGQMGVTPSYVRKIIRPLREDSTDTSAELAAGNPDGAHTLLPLDR